MTLQDLFIESCDISTLVNNIAIDWLSEKLWDDPWELKFIWI